MKTIKYSESAFKKASNTNRKKIADWVYTQRTKSGLTQQALATMCGLDRKTVNRIENEAFSPNIDTMTRLAVVLESKIPSLI